MLTYTFVLVTTHHKNQTFSSNINHLLSLDSLNHQMKCTNPQFITAHIQQPNSGHKYHENYPFSKQCTINFCISFYKNTPYVSLLKSIISLLSTTLYCLLSSTITWPVICIAHRVFRTSNFSNFRQLIFVRNIISSTFTNCHILSFEVLR